MTRREIIAGGGMTMLAGAMPAAAAAAKSAKVAPDPITDLTAAREWAAGSVRHLAARRRRFAHH